MILEKELKNGIPVLMEKLDSVKSVAIGLYIKTGAKYENENEHGISHMLEHMLFKGTTTRTPKQISETIDNVGGHMNAFTSKEVTSYYVTILGEHIGIATDVLSDMYKNSTIPEEELKKEKKVIIEEIRMYEDIPEDKIHDVNSEFVLSGSALSNSVLGSEESVSDISRDQLMKYYKERYTKDNMVISVSGDFDTKKIMEDLENKFGDIENTKKERNYNESFGINSGKKTVSKDINQVHLCFNTKGKSYLMEDKYSLSIISNILGGNMSSRLFQKVREERGLCYSIYSYTSSYKEGGMFTIYAGTTQENYEEVIGIIEEEFETIRKNCITQEELDITKTQLLSDMVLGLETTRSRMGRMGITYINYGRYISVEETIEKIKKITLEDIQNCANEIFQKENYSVSIIGNFDNK